MNIKTVLSVTTKLIADNSPVILTALGVTGTITTAYLTAKAAYKSAGLIHATETREFVMAGHDNNRLSNKAKFHLVWRLYVPAVATGTMTCVCIIGANYIGTRKAAALATACSISERALEEYRAKVVEKIGPTDEKEIRDEVVRDRIERATGNSEVFFVGNEVLCHDAYSSRYFHCEKERVRKAVNDIAQEILHSDFASLTDFYTKVGLEPTSGSDEMGWNLENMIEIGWATHESPDGRPCLSYDFVVPPMRNPWQFR